MDIEGVDLLFEEWAEPLYRYAYRLTRSHDLSDDLVQDAFLSLHIELRRGTDIRNPRGWMLGLVANQAARLYRKSKRWEQSQNEIEALPAPPDFGNDSEFAADALPSLLKLLSARETEVVTLRLQSLKYREIAEQLGISPKSVATLLARALSKMQQGAGKIRAAGEEFADWRHKDASLQ